MKKLLFSLILLIVQIGKSETNAQFSRMDHASVAASTKQNLQATHTLDKNVSMDELNSNADQDDESHDRAVVKVVKVLGFTLLGLAGAFTALVVLAIGNGGIGGC